MMITHLFRCPATGQPCRRGCFGANLACDPSPDDSWVLWSITAGAVIGIVLGILGILR